MNDATTPAAPEHPFDLRDLARVPADGGAGERRVQDLAATDPFSVIGMGGAQAFPKVAPLEGLLREKPARASLDADRSNLAFRFGDAAFLSSAPAADHARRRPPLKPTQSEDQVFDDLHEEYRRVVRDPDQLAGRTDWGSLLARRREPAPTYDALRSAAGQRDIFEILGRKRGIDQLIESFDPLGRSGLLDKAENEDVLRLFSPDLPQSSKHAVPSLTRREHHELSPDSHVRLGATRRDEPESSA